MKICYIAHPIGAGTPEGIETNLADLRRIIKYINLNYPDVVPFAPYYADIVSLNDMIPAERERGISNDIAVFQSGIIQELWLTGDRVSNGMSAEVQLAIKLGIPIFDKIGVL